MYCFYHETNFVYAAIFVGFRDPVYTFMENDASPTVFVIRSSDSDSLSLDVSAGIS